MVSVPCGVATCKIKAFLLTIWLIKKEAVFDQMSGEHIIFSTIHAALLLLPIADRSLSAVY